MAAIASNDLLGCRAQILDNVHLTFPYYHQSTSEDLRQIELRSIEYKVIVRAQDAGYVAEVYYHIDTWKPFMRGGERKHPNEALESLLCVSAAVVAEATQEKGLRGWRRGKIVGEGLVDESPVK